MTEDTVYYSQNTWNLARGIASAALDLTEQTVETPTESTPVGEFYGPLVDVYTEYETQHDVWPFDGVVDLLAVVDDRLGLDAENRSLNDLAKAISTRIQDDPQYEYQSEPDPEEEATAGEADSETAAGDVSETPFDEPVYEVAKRLYRCFVDHDPDTTYREIQGEFDSPFPRRSVVLTELANTTCRSKSDRIENIAKWVNEWFDNAEQVQEVNRYAREPMGKSLRSD